MRSILGTVLVAAALAAAAATTARAQDSQVVEEIIVQVNDDIITRSQFNTLFESVSQRLSSQFSGAELEQEMEVARKAVFNSMINQLVVRQKAEARGIVFSEELFREQLEAIKEQIGARNDEEVQLALANQGFTLQQFRDFMEYQYLLSGMFRMEVGRDLYESESRLQMFYEENEARYTEPGRTRLSQISFSFSVGDRDGALQRAQAALERLLGGEDFGQVFRSVTAQAPAEASGDIGYVQIDALRPEMAAALEGLQAGRITDIVETPEAFVILKVTERVPDRVLPYEEIKARVQADYQEDTRLREVNNYLVRLKSQSYVKIVCQDFEGLYEEDFFQAS